MRVVDCRGLSLKLVHDQGLYAAGQIDIVEEIENVLILAELLKVAVESLEFAIFLGIEFPE